MKSILSTVEEKDTIGEYTTKMTPEEQRTSTVEKRNMGRVAGMIHSTKRTTTLIARNVRVNPDLTWLFVILIASGTVVFLITKILYGVSAKEASDYIAEGCKIAAVLAFSVYSLFQKLKTPPGPIAEYYSKEKDDFQRTLL